jgi:hypothetical protein
VEAEIVHISRAVILHRQIGVEQRIAHADAKILPRPPLQQGGRRRQVAVEVPVVQAEPANAVKA